jgi:hypothetical protein
MTKHKAQKQKRKNLKSQMIPNNKNSRNKISIKIPTIANFN